MVHFGAPGEWWLSVGRAAIDRSRRQVTDPIAVPSIDTMVSMLQ